MEIIIVILLIFYFAMIMAGGLIITIDLYKTLKEKKKNEDITKRH